MSATQPIGVDSTPVSSETAVRRQLDALAKGEIDHVTFLSNMKERFRLEPDDNWEVLSLLDQYYRRGKITLEVFRALKSGIAEYILGPQNSAPGQQSDAPTLRTVVAPPASSAPPRVAAPPPAAASSAPPPPAEVPTPVARTAVTPGGVAPGAVAPGAVAPSAARAAPAPVTTAAVPVAPRPTASARAPLPQAPVNSHFENTMQMPILTADEGAGAALARAAHTDAPHHAATYTGAAAHAAPITPSREVAAAAAAVAAAHAAAEAPAPAAAAPAREVHVGELLRNRYRLDSLIGRGASGIVFEANDPFRLNLPPSGKRVALKALRTPDPRGIFINQLRQEFHHLQLLSHPNIVRAFDFDRDGGLAFFTMELLNGEHLNRVLQTRGTPLDRPYAFAIIRDVGSAVAYAHSRGIAHGDINPQNVFITSRGEVRVLGFGASNKLSGNGGAPEFEQATAMADTYRYASCEVLQGGRPDASDDLYALSCLAYLLLSGKHPFADRTSLEARAERRRPRRPAGLRYRQWQTLRAGLQIDAKKRPTDVKAWLEGMELGAAAAQLPPASELIETRAGRKGGLKWALAAVLVAALIGGGYWLYTNQDVFMSQPPTESSQAVSPGAPAPSEVAPPAASPPAAQPSAAARPGAKPPAPTPAPVAPAVARAPAPAPVAPVHKADTTPAPTPTSPPAAPIVAAPATARVAAPASTKVEMAVDTMDAAPTDSVVRVTVRRKGNLHGTTSFTWWTESGTAKPGVDFSPMLPHVQEIPDGQASVVLSVPILSTTRAQEKGFYVGIEEADGGAQIGARSLTQITLPATE